MKYISRHRTVEAIQWTGENRDEVIAFGEGHVRGFRLPTNAPLLEISSPWMRSVMAHPTDWIVKEKGIIYSLTDEGFKNQFLSESSLYSDSWRYISGLTEAST